MKLAVCSDLHLEFGPIELKNTENVDVLILAGDIVIANDIYLHDRASAQEYCNMHVKAQSKAHHVKSALDYYNFFDQISSEFPHVIYIAGNHEFYHGKWMKSLEVLKNFTREYHNIHFLERQSFELDGVVFLGATLWTDMNNQDPLTMATIKDHMNDFNLITNDENGFSKLRPSSVVSRHYLTTNFIREALKDESKKYVVVCHHAPTRLSIKPQYEKDIIANGAYSSDLSDFILDHPQIKLWIHGHTHHNFDYMMGETRVFCNPRGYIGYESQAEQFKLEVIEV